MEKTVIDYRLEYNELLDREKKAESYINDPIRTPEEIEKWGPAYKDILNRLEELLQKIGYYYPHNILNGWIDDEQMALDNIVNKE